MDKQDRDRKEYELAVLVKDEADLAPVVALVREHNGEAPSEPRAKRLALAYEIKKRKEAVFAYFTFKAFGEDVKNLERELNTKPEVIRSLIIASPAPAMTMERQPLPMGAAKRRTRVTRTGTAADAAKPVAPAPLSNEALEKKIEEILQ
ncbi:MAG TPA: 30S ribosomal protein S6 [Candidatus Paceibacterota bacterium]|nr:30S ribosomal protein S6 [Candidatus Paceibacterota bacterium]